MNSSFIIGFLEIILILILFLIYLYLIIKGLPLQLKIYKEYRFNKKNYGLTIIFFLSNWYDAYDVDFESEKFIKLNDEIQKFNKKFKTLFLISCLIFFILNIL